LTETQSREFVIYGSSRLGTYSSSEVCPDCAKAANDHGAKLETKLKKKK
jgi:hypothetical protein